MSKRNADRPIHEQDGGPVPHHLPPRRSPTRPQSVKAGCWPVLLLVLTLFACPVAEGVRQFAEPIDTVGCQADCRIVGLHMSRYEYWNDTCWCALEDGGEIKAHEFLPTMGKGE